MSQIRPWFALIASVLLASASLAIALAVLPPFGLSLVVFVVAIASSVPGVVLAWLLFAPGSRGAALLLGPIWGYALSTVATLPLWLWGARDAELLWAPLIAAVVLAPLGWWMRGTLVTRPLGKADVAGVCVLVVLLAVLVAPPFAKVGRDLPDGSRAYRAYFTADFVWRMAVVAELAKGDVPPRNPFHLSDPLHYYWLAHVPAAAEYRMLRRHLRLEPLLLANSIAVDVLFLLFLYGFVRHWTSSAAAATAACAGVLVASSFEGIEQLWQLHRASAPIELVRTLNVEAVTRWFYGGMPIDGLQRVLWYQPQHAVAYGTGLSAVLIAAQAVRPIPVPLALVSGTLLAAAVLFSSFSGMMLTAMAALTLGWRVWREQGLVWTPAAAAWGALPLALAAIMALRLDYVDSAQGSVVEFLLNPAATYNAWIALPLSFGPFLILAIIATAVAVRQRESGLWPLGVIVAVSFAFYLFVNVVDHQHVYVGWRAGHMLFIAFAALAAFVLSPDTITAARRRLWLRIGAGVLALLALPTVVIDAYNTQDITNTMEAAMGRWTLILGRDELAALQWVRQFTSSSETVQVDPVARDPATWSYIPAFAERRMAGGIPISMVPVEKYWKVSRAISDLFRRPTAESIYQGAAALRIDYIFVGEPERNAHPQLEHRLEMRPDLFRRVFSEGSVKIYFVEGRPH